MKMSKLLRLVFLAALAAVPFVASAQEYVSMDVERARLNTSLKHIGDYVLIDPSGHIFDAGHIILDINSVFSVLAKAPEAVGTCTFIHAPVNADGSLGQSGVYDMRYFFRFQDSVIRFNSNVPEKEVDVHFDFDPSKEYLQGVIRNGDSDVGIFRMRIRNFAKEKAVK